MKPRATSLLVSGGLLAALVGVATWLPVPYVLLSPGPTFNTIGEFDGTQLITVEGPKTFPTDGELLLTTVSETGGPYGDITMLEAAWGWLKDGVAVLPERLLYPEQLNRDEAEEKNASAFIDSQANATAAALTFLKEPTREVVLVSSVSADGPSDDKLEVGDEIVSIDGQRPTSSAQAASIIKSKKPGDTIVFRVVRDEKNVTVSVVAEASPKDEDQAVVGITVTQTVQGEDITVDYGLDNVGGPSAGLMFSLGIVDTLTKPSLTDGVTIAGTGTIDPDGLVGPIGGVQQKVVGAKRDGAEFFLTPTKNCLDASAAAPEGLRLVRVESLADAVDSLKRIQKKQPVPQC